MSFIREFLCFALVLISGFRLCADPIKTCQDLVDEKNQAAFAEKQTIEKCQKWGAPKLSSVILGKADYAKCMEQSNNLKADSKKIADQFEKNIIEKIISYERDANLKNNKAAQQDLILCRKLMTNVPTVQSTNASGTSY